jgi:hypothetical protein
VLSKLGLWSALGTYLIGKYWSFADVSGHGRRVGIPQVTAVHRSDLERRSSIGQGSNPSGARPMPG